MLGRNWQGVNPKSRQNPTLTGLEEPDGGCSLLCEPLVSSVVNAFVSFPDDQLGGHSLVEWNGESELQSSQRFRYFPIRNQFCGPRKIFIHHSIFIHSRTNRANRVVRLLAAVTGL
ncbi:MAG: hypothetical protein JWN74_3095 [Acidobacteriaceae bacterium]|nr:hypothetical protein [Acidobacteriaceae bacterium]